MNPKGHHFAAVRILAVAMLGLIASSGAIASNTDSFQFDGHQLLAPEHALSPLLPLSVHSTAGLACAGEATLIGPAGPVTAHARCLDGGHELQVQPAHDLRPGSRFTLLLKTGETLGSVSFATAALPALPPLAKGARAGRNVEEWAPNTEGAQYDWRIHEDQPAAPLEALSAPTGHTAVSGRLARFDNAPLAGAVVSLDGHEARTDALGRFLLDDVKPGPQVLEVDGTAVWIDGGHYTKHFLHIELAQGRTTALQAPVYLARVDPATEVGITSPTDHEVVLTHPSMPGVEVHIPQGAVLRDFDGSIVRRVSITPVPLNRTAFGVPSSFSVYFTLQPGGAFIDGDPAQAVTITYPNPTHLTANAPMDFWNYDPHTGWKIYGRGHVSADGKQVVADAGVGYRELMSFGFGSAPAPTFDSKLNGGSNGADPVDLSTGLFTYTRTDLSINDVIPISLTWHYQQSESSVGDVGMGTHLSYGARIYEKSTSEWDVLLPDGTKVPFTDNVVTKVDNQGQTYLASGQCLQVPGQFFGATITMVLNPAYSHQSQYKLTFRDKSAWLFDTQTPVPLVEIDDANGNAVKLNWADANGTDYYSVVQPRPNRIFLSKVTSPSGRFITFTYPNLGDVNQTLQSAQDNTGRQVQYTYKTFATGGPQYLSTIIEPDQIAKSSPKPVTFAWYSTDPTIRFKSVTDKLKNTRLLNHYDTIGRVQQQDMALEPGMTVTPTWIFNYTGGANLGDTATQLTLTNPRGYNTVYKFDSSGYVTEQDVGANVTAPYHQLVYTFTRDPINHSVVSMKDPLQRVTSYGYDDRGNVNLVTRLVNNSAETVSTQLVYDPNLGRLTSLRNEVQQTTNFDYDSLGNLVGITDPLGRLTQFNNNSLGLPTQIIDPSNHSTTLGYKLADLASVRDPLGRTVTYTTDELGRRDSVTDTAGNETLIGYDALDNEITLTDPLKNTTQLQRDGEGNLQNLTLAGHTNPYVYGYDAYGRVATVTDPLTRGSSSQYDGNGNRTQYIDFKSQTTLYNYDPFDRLHQVTYKDGSTTTYTYDDGNRLTQVVDSLYGTTTITPDDYDHVSSVAGRYGQPVGYQIDSIGRTSTMTYPSGLKVSYQYYADNRLNTMTLVSSGETFTAAYLANGRLDTLKLPNKSMRTHLYNEPGDQLTSITYTDANSAVLGAWTYGYDANTGRLQSMSDSFPLSVNVAGSALTTTPFDDANEITGIGSTSLSHDLNGSQTSDIGLTFKYDARGRLVQAVKGTLTTNFEINPFGLRDRKYASNSTETRFVYDLRGHLIAELDKNNATITEYIWFGNMPVMVRNANAGVMNEFYIFSDNLDTPRRVIVPSTNAARWIWNSDAYGNGVPNGNPNGIGGYSFHLRFPGQFADSETGLFYNSARNYNPATGRYIESDPIGFFAALNQYGYASGNPISTDDPLGLYPAILVYLPDGSFYIPLTQVKNAAQASSYGLPIGWLTAIAVPPGVNPQAQVNFWASTYNNGLGAFASYWWPGGPNDYKLQNAMYDAYGNFAYGATGAAAGYSCNTLTGVADALHRGHNNPINTRDITLGYSAISRGGSLSIIDYTPSKP